MKNLTEGRTLTGAQLMDCDVVVVGSGAGGAVAAHELAAAGLTVLVLEAGPYLRPSDMTQRELEMSRKVFVDGGAQGPADGSMSILQGEAVGGSTIVNGEVCFRTPDFVLEEWARDHGVRGLGAADLAPVFEEVERAVNVTANTDEQRVGGRMMDAGMRALGIEPRPIARNVKDCRGCAYCFWGCAWGCKQSMEQSYLPAAAELGARLVSDARVESIRLEGGAARGVRARLPHGSLEVRSRAVVLAAGATGSPLLLLDHGLGGGEVGRHLAVHPVVFASGVWDEDKPERLPTMLASYTQEFMPDFLIETGSGSRAFGAPGVPGFGAEHKRRLAAVPRTWGGGAIVRDVEAPGRVRRGRKREKIVEYALAEATRLRLRRAMKKLAEICLAAGSTEIWFPTTEPFFVRSSADLDALETLPLGPADVSLVSYHPQGTCRMGAVTDHDGAVRGASDLYVMDGSLFPTPVGVNPQISIMAVSALLSRRLADRLRR